MSDDIKNKINDADLTDYETVFEKSWVNKELHKARNWGPFLHNGLRWGFKGLIGVALAAIDQLIFRGKLPFTLNHPTPDYACLKKASETNPITYPKPDGIVSFDKLSSVFLSPLDFGIWLLLINIDSQNFHLLHIFQKVDSFALEHLISSHLF